MGLHLRNMKKYFKIIFIISFLLISFVSFNFVRSEDWWDNDWNYREQIIILNAGNSELINYPAYINLPRREGMQSDYDDLRFVSNGFLLDYEIESFDAIHADIWLKIPSLSVPSVSIWMYYGNDNATNGQNKSGVWDANYKAVLHLSEISGNVFDSTANSNNGNNYSTSTGVGIVSGSRYFSGSDNSYIQILPSFSLDIPKNFTVSLWYKNDGDQVQYATLINKEDAGQAYRDRNWWISFTDRNQYNWFKASAVGNDNYIMVDTGKKRLDGNWHYVAITYDGSKSNIIVDGGVDIGSHNKDGKNLEGQGDPVLLGKSNGTRNRYYKGWIDEVRISNTVRSSDWIKQSYVMVVDNSGYVGFGGVTPKPKPIIQIKKELPMEQIAKILNLNLPGKPVGGIIEDKEIDCNKNPNAEGCSQ